MIDQEKEKLRRYHFKLNRVPVDHNIPDDTMTEYWIWENGQWNNCNDWYVDPFPESTAQWRGPITKENPAITRGCESEHAWNCLLKYAKIFGY